MLGAQSFSVDKPQPSGGVFCWENAFTLLWKLVPPAFASAIVKAINTPESAFHRGRRSSPRTPNTTDSAATPAPVIPEAPPFPVGSGLQVAKGHELWATTTILKEEMAGMESRLLANLGNAIATYMGPFEQRTQQVEMSHDVLQGNFADLRNDQEQIHKHLE